jgi:DNA-binding FadR family transcriptional regulator
MAEIDPIGNPEYTYVQVANAIAARIQAGEIIGKLPAERNLAREMGVSYQTVRHGIGLLRDRGMVVTRRQVPFRARLRPWRADPLRRRLRLYALLPLPRATPANSLCA